jgi:hypothetical protein
MSGGMFLDGALHSADEREAARLSRFHAFIDS